MGYGFEFIIDKQLWCHHYETKCKQKSIDLIQNERIPSFMFVVDQRIDYVADEQRKQDPRKIFECKLKLRNFFYIKRKLINCFDYLTVSYSLVDDSTYDPLSLMRNRGTSPRNFSFGINSKSTTFLIFQSSINNPMNTETRIIKLVSLS